MDSDDPISRPTPGELMRRVREAAELSQRQLAERAGVVQSVLSRVEREGAVTVALMAQLLRPLGLQLRLETEPLIDVIEAELDAEAGRSVEERFDDLAERKDFDGFHLERIDEALSEFPHCYTGLTGAALLGAPVHPRLCELVLYGDELTLDRFSVWLDEQWAIRWDDREQRYSDYLPLHPSEPGTQRWTSPLGQFTVSFVDVFPPVTTVTLKGRPYEVVGMAQLDAEDPHAKRVLERVRRRLASGE